jgi:hypothetical protein
MSTLGMLTIALIYAVSAFDQFRLGNTGMGLAFVGWAFGQMGMAYAVYRT